MPDEVFTTSFDVQPYVGAHPIVFGMGPAEVHALLGAPWRERSPTWGGGFSDYWMECRINVGYGDDMAVKHVGFTPGRFSLSLSGSPLWSPADHPDPNPRLLQLDPDPVEHLGFLIFNRIGVTTTGYHDEDQDDRSIAVYPRGAWDMFLPKAVAPDLRRYRRAN